MKIPLAKADLSGNEMKYIEDVMKSGVLSIGPWIEKFEKKIADYVGVKHAIGVNSGTSALHLLMLAYGIGRDDEVITSPFSFIASSNAMLFVDAVPVFADIDPLTYNMDVSRVESKITKKTKAILAVDAFGQPIDMPSLREIADRHGLILLEDAAEAFGSEYRSHKAGSLADAAIYAFYPNKVITTAEGGIIVTNSNNTADLSRSMRSQGRAVTGQWLEHEMLGYNYRLSEIHSAIGVAQAERIDEILERRNNVAEYYNERLSRLDSVVTPYISVDVTKMSWFVYVIRVKKGTRNELMEHLTKKGIGCKPYFTPIHTQKFYMERFAGKPGFRPGDFPNTEDAGESCLAIPFYTGMTRDEQDYVIEEIGAYLDDKKS